MHRQTRVAVRVAEGWGSPERLIRLAEAGVDAFCVQATSDPEWHSPLGNVRAAERQVGRPLAVVVELPGEEPAADQLDNETLAHFSDHGVDYVAFSAARGVSDIEETRTRLAEHGSTVAGVIVKFDHAQNFENIDGLIRAADAVFVTEKGLSSLEFWSVPVAQKTIARQCQIAAKPCVVVRDISLAQAVSSEPTRHADVFDLANIVTDHADGILLTGERAKNVDWVAAVAAVQMIVSAAEGFLEITDRPMKVGFGQPPNTATLAYAIRHILKMQEIAAVAVYSLTGATARVISKNWIDCPILAFSNQETTARQMCLYHGVASRHVAQPLDTAELLHMASELAKQLNIATPGDRIIVVSGHPVGAQEQANGFIVETVN